MSTHTVPVVRIDNVEKHPNADRLDIISIKGWQCVSGRDNFKPGDLAVYIPIDSVLSGPIEAFLFPPDSKVRLSNSRVKTIKLRGAISQGMVVPVRDLEVFGLRDWAHSEGTDVSLMLGITKYEPPAQDTPKALRSKNPQAKEYNNPEFHKYTDIENIKNYPGAFQPGQIVYVTEKLHGTSARYGILTSVPSNLWDRIKKFFGLLPKFQFCYGSRNRQLQGRLLKQTFYTEDVYGIVARKYNIEMKLHPGEVLYGEIVGEGIQKGYTYGFTKGEYGFFAYDVQVDQQYLPPAEFQDFCDSRGIPTVPRLFEGPFDKDGIEKLVGGPSTFAGQPIREGIVIKPATERRAYFGRRCVLKWINSEYLLTDPTDFH